MAYPELTMSVADLARDAKSAAEKLRDRARKLIVMLEAEFSSDDAESLGVKLVHSEDGQSAQISSPFGEARANFSVFLNERGLYGRYSFARKWRDNLDRDAWKEIFFIDITADGQIVSEFIDETSKRFSVTQPYRDQYFALALVITAALGRNPADAI